MTTSKKKSCSFISSNDDGPVEFKMTVEISAPGSAKSVTVETKKTVNIGKMTEELVHTMIMMMIQDLFFQISQLTTDSFV